MAQRGREEIAKRGRDFAVRREFHVGPLPPADELAKYDAIVPGLANRVVTMAESQSAHRRDMERLVIGGNATAQLRGQIFAFILGCGALGIAAWLIAKGHEWAGVALIGLEVLGLATVFVTGRVAAAKERQSRRTDPPPTGGQRHDASPE